ncbi:MAG TPA: MEDS domain-containing protein [archaeon]|nr:MEDS domain-containing protein [archaeon]
MPEKKRKSGIKIIGEIPWGTHLCHFYQTRKDLLDILVPYFKAGLENNEFCMWITAGLLGEEEAEEAMRKAVPHFDRYRKKGQLEIVPHGEWYLKDSAFSQKRVFKGWVDKLEQALKNGYDGLRLTGNTIWLEKKDWKDFTDHEEEINRVIGKYRMLAICSYSLDKCSAAEIIDVVDNHQFALIRRMGKWDVIQSVERMEVLERLMKYIEENRALLKAIPDLVLVQNREGTYLDYKIPNHYVSSWSPNQLLGKNIMDLWPEKVAKIGLKLIKKALQKGEIQTLEFQLTIDNKLQYFEARFVPFEEDKVLSLVRDITDRKRTEEQIKASLKEKEVLLQEIHHRVKNNLQVVSSLLDLTRLQAPDQKTIDLFTEARRRIYTMALVHTQLYDSERFDQIDFSTYLQKLTEYLSNVYLTKKDLVTTYVKGSDIFIPVTQAIPCGIALSEVITNSFKHAFKEGQKGAVEISIKSLAGNRIAITVKDNGIGIPKDFDIDRVDSRKTLGLRLVRELVQQQLDGKIRIERKKGTQISIEFKRSIEA